MKSELVQPDPVYPDTTFTLSKSEVYELKKDIIRHYRPSFSTRAVALENFIEELDRAQQRYRR